VFDMSPLAAKTVFAAVILLAALLGGLLPLAGRPASRRSHFMSWGNAFAAGIFLGTGLIHMLGEATEAWSALGWHYPMPLLLAATGFMLFLLVEHVLLPADAHSVAHAHSGHALPADEIERLTGFGIPHALLMALSIHSVIAGIALGGQAEFAGAFYIFLAIIAHKSSAAFALGVALRRSTVPRARGRWLVGLFSLATPLGIAAGAVASNLLRSLAGRYFDAAFLALAGGSFLYIASMDILQDEFLHAGGRFVKWLWAVVAIALTALLSIWI
jgi:zinc transporter 1/2/3